MFRSSEELHEAAKFLLKLTDQVESGEITEAYLLQKWKEFRRKADKYIESLQKEVNGNPFWS